MAESSNMNGQVIDGVKLHPKSGIKIIISGAGIAGLLAAVECWRKGHDVRVLEKGNSISTLGDGFGLGPHALATIREYPTMFEEWKTIGHNVEMSFVHPDGREAWPFEEMQWNKEDVAPHALSPLHPVPGLHFRQDMALMLERQCQRAGIPLQFGVHIVTYLEDVSAGTATVLTADGRSFTADVVIAAEGLATKSHSIVLGEPVRAVPSGLCADRFAYPTNRLIDAPLTKEALKQMTRPLGKVFNGPGMHAVYALTPDRLSLTLIHPDDGTARETWSSNIDVAQMKAVFDSARVTWDPLLAEAMDNLPQGRLTRWQICWRDPQPKWTSVGGHVVQIGDAAHAYLPSAANGASMAMEDALSIAECLRLGGKGRVNLATKIHELLRYQRTALVQRCGFANKSALHDNTMEDIVASDRKPLDYGKWLWAHNAERYVTENFDAALTSLVSGNPFENTNLPPGHQFEDWDVSKEETGACKFATKDLRNNGDWGCV